MQHGLLNSIARFSANQPIERLLPAHDAINQLLTQPAVGRGKLCAGQGAVEDGLDEVPARRAFQGI